MYLFENSTSNTVPHQWDHEDDESPPEISAARRAEETDATEDDEGVGRKDTSPAHHAENTVKEEIKI